MERYQFDEREQHLMENSRIPFAVYQFIDRRVVTLALSRGMCDLLGLDDLADAYSLMDRDMYRSTHPDDVARVADAAFHFASAGGEYDVVYRSKPENSEDYKVIHAHGEHIVTETGIRLAVIWYADEGVYAAGGPGAKYKLNGVFSKALREESMVRRSYYDNLTGLPNLGFFFELATRSRDSLALDGKKTAMLFFDLCRMKSFNREHGFAEGDRLLLAFSRRLAAFFGNENCAHFGEDNFAAYTDAEGLDSKLADLFAACAEINDGKNLPVRVGIYLWQDAKMVASTACDHAKVACDTLRGVYYSTYCRFTESMLTAAAKRQYFIDNLDRALSEGWIQAYYQPIVRAANGKVCDEEALARWTDPEKGSFTPAEFTPVLEEAKLIYKLDLFMVDQALDKMKRLADEGIYIVPCSVNFSRSDFDACDLVEEIRRRVDDRGIPRSMLTIEITESVIGSDFEYMREQVDRFHAMGFRVWMDDFGSGYSSLDVLQSIRFDLIKFDMLFMQQFDQSDKCKIILTELTKMAIALGVETVTEGVETAEQAEFLREIGCTRLQGFYFCRPLPLEGVLDRYHTGGQIGFENPEESGYYASIGKINLYDLAVVTNEDTGAFDQYFDTLPMAILESSGDEATIIRCNRSYREFMKRMFGIDLRGVKVRFDAARDTGNSFMDAVRQCGRDGNRIILDEEMRDGSSVHFFVRRVAINPVTGTAALVAVVLSVK